MKKNIAVRFNFHDKINRYKNIIEYYLYKNRLVADDYNNLSTAVNNIIASKMDLINMDYMEFIAFRL